MMFSASIGGKLEAIGWRQGSIIKSEDVKSLLLDSGISYSDDIVLLVASHSCDIAQYSLENEPFIEISSARKITNKDGNFTSKKDPRKLHIPLLIQFTEQDVPDRQYIELRAFEKFNIKREYFVNIQPDEKNVLQKKYAHIFREWLADRYRRSAFPTEFNDRLFQRDRKLRDKIKNAAKKMNEHIDELLVKITPEEEIGPNEIYSVN